MVFHAPDTQAQARASVFSCRLSLPVPLPTGPQSPIFSTPQLSLFALPFPLLAAFLYLSCPGLSRKSPCSSYITCPSLPLHSQVVSLQNTGRGFCPTHSLSELKAVKPRMLWLDLRPLSLAMASFYSPYIFPLTFPPSLTPDSVSGHSTASLFRISFPGL